MYPVRECEFVSFTPHDKNLGSQLQVSVILYFQYLGNNNTVSDANRSWELLVTSNSVTKKASQLDMLLYMQRRSHLDLSQSHTATTLSLRSLSTSLYCSIRTNLQAEP